MDMTDFSTTYDDRASFQTVFNTVATGRKTYKTLKEKQEVIWPPCLEAALIDGKHGLYIYSVQRSQLGSFLAAALEKYRPNSLTDPKDLRRFPRRNQFISEHIFQITGKRRTPKQVGSRLQQLRDTCSSEHSGFFIASGDCTLTDEPSVLYLLDRRIFENSDESSAGGEAGPSRCSLISPKRANPYPYRASHPNPMQASNQDETAVLSPGIRPKPPLLCCSIPHSVAYACSDLESVPVSFSLQAPMDYHPNTPLEDYTQPNVALTDFSGSVATKQPLSPGIIGLYCPNSAPPLCAATSGPQMDPHKSFSHWLLNGAGQEGRESPQSTSSPLNPAFPLSIAPDDTSATYMHLQRLTEQAFPALQGNASPVEANLLATPPQLLVDISFVSMTPSPRPPLSPGDANSLLSDSQTATSFIPMTSCEREQWLRRSSSSMAIGHHDIHRIKAGIPAGFGIHELRPSGTFVSSRVLDYQLLRSIFRAYIGSILVYSEVVGVEPKYVQGQGGSAPYFYYTSKILPSFWEQLTIAHGDYHKILVVHIHFG